MRTELGLGIEYNPMRDFTPKKREEMYELYKSFLEKTDEDTNLLENEKKEIKRKIYIEMQIYEVKYETYHANIEKDKKLFLEGRINSFSLN
jgi:hypothetical protein